MRIKKTKQEVIKALMICGDSSSQCIGCPYLSERTRNTNCANHLCKDAIALLQEQENGIKPKSVRQEDGSIWCYCGKCGYMIERGYQNYCSVCGTKIKGKKEND